MGFFKLNEIQPQPKGTNMLFCLCLPQLPNINYIITALTNHLTIAGDVLSAIAVGPNHCPGSFDPSTYLFCE
jgi:hypothetical protein